MILNQNIILDYEIDNVDNTPEWWDFADGDYVQMELKYGDKLVISGETTHDNIILQIDSFLKGFSFGTNQKICVKRGIITPSKFYDCESCYY